ncbi:putative nuclease [Serratia phage vB_SmaM-Otaku]|uniref:Nuclease n=1 Tax=Serratia phage vB_SmaM-Otaku TaxID=2932867 RepID=A0AAE9HEN8_9CAUD|nr:putative nuclease [Serratia phage vB_SmaM-Otaku]UPU16044.1 putative nuclease [Serratia phage vB_SmaM-Otaku]
MTPEGKVQTYAKAEFENLGALVRKIRYEGRNGCPDLLVLLPCGIVWFVEVKKDEATGLDPHQAREHERMQKRGANVFTVGSKSQVDSLITNYYSHATNKGGSDETETEKADPRPDRRAIGAKAQAVRRVRAQ